MCGTKIVGLQEPVVEPEQLENLEMIETPDFINDTKDDTLLDRELVNEGDQRDKTVCMFSQDGIAIPESIEQKFSRAAPIAVLLKERSGEEITIDRPEFILGKNPHHTDFAVRDNNTVSRVHASVTWDEEEGYKIVDLGSMNGTYVNGENVDKEGSIISDGDLIELSDERFRVQIKDID